MKVDISVKNLVVYCLNGKNIPEHEVGILKILAQFPEGATCTAIFSKSLTETKQSVVHVYAKRLIARGLVTCTKIEQTIFGQTTIYSVYKLTEFGSKFIKEIEKSEE